MFTNQQIDDMMSEVLNDACDRHGIDKHWPGLAIESDLEEAVDPDGDEYIMTKAWIEIDHNIAQVTQHGHDDPDPDYYSDIPHKQMAQWLMMHKLAGADVTVYEAA